MAARQKAIPPSKPLDVSDGEWAEAVRRGDTVRFLAAGTNNKATIRAAADALGLSAAQVYRLIGKFRTAPVTASLIVTKPGRKKGSRFLPGPVERQIDDAIEAVFKAREQPTVEKLRKDIGVNCRDAGLKPPSRKATQARISARSLREMTQARKGSKAARQRFIPIASSSDFDVG